MARIFPDTPPQVLPGEVLRTFKALKFLPDSFIVWHHLAPWQLDMPDFLVLQQDNRALLIKVSLSSSDDAFSAAQLILIEDNRIPLGTGEAHILTDFIHNLNLPSTKIIEPLIIFPNIPDKKVQESRLSRDKGELQWAGREILQPGSEKLWEVFFAQKPLDSISLEKIRHKFTPEIVVPEDMTVRPPVEHRIQAGLTGYLLDYNQEEAVKSDLSFGADGQNLGQDFRLNIINGVAGSGKTLILLYRLKLLFHLYPNKHFLVLTHNRPLNHDLQSRFARLNGRLPDNIEWYTFNGWCFAHWPKSSAWKKPISIQKRSRLIHQVWKEFLFNTAITEHMLMSEIDWIKDQLPLNKEDYLNVDRRGRGFGLSGDQRNRIWGAIEAYQLILKQTNSLDWGDIPQLLWQFTEDGNISLPQYDFILVDEAQFFAPLWISLIQKTVKGNNSHLFIVADPTQGFLRRKTTWKSLGIEARGRTRQLRKSYRTTREILQFATMFYRSRLPDEKDEDILVPDLLNMPTGVIPEMIALASSQDEIARVVNEVAEFIREGYPKKHLLLLHANGQGVKSLIEAINRSLGKNTAMDPKETYPGTYVRVTTLNAGAGLESPIVFLIGLRELFESEQSLRLSDEEREELIRDNTRKIYMASTRAGQRLVFTYVGDLPKELRAIFNI